MKKIFFGALAISFLYGCGGSGGTEPEPTPAAPAKAILITPTKNELCTQGVVTSATLSTVTLKWSEAANTESYQVDLKNLETGALATQTINATTLSVQLSRNTPYAWSVTSKSTKSSTTSQSETWRFYNSGPATTNYAPFPAELVSPAIEGVVTAANGKISLTWNGQDVDNDIATYDVYLGTTNTPSLLKAGLTLATLTDVAVTNNTYYYWKVITKDSKGNTSDSGTYRFKVN
ncbi:hypothetical protein [Mucilaginibacter sp. CSA2-8R]|uniref:hypothetical protein n=1 Tax=Mucilaginibacter sp. CSA2-8R TaxID=3141542 RepID=UPI00315CE095